jgi:hypothetical protein
VDRSAFGEALRGGGRVAEADDDLRATAESLQDDADRLKDLEASKERLDPSDPEVLKLAHEAKDLARTIADKATVELALAEELQGA